MTHSILCPGEHPSVGTRFGHVTVIGPAFRVTRFDKSGTRCDPTCVCQCDCGEVFARPVGKLPRSNVCERFCRLRRPKPKGPTGHPLYNTWNSIIYRCFNPKCQAYYRYGGRGITMCDEWRESFDAFIAWAEPNGWRRELEIDRIDNDGNYEPGNCRWVTRKENNRNRRNGRILEAFGEQKSFIEWTEDQRCKVTKSGLHGRLKRGWSTEEAISAPPQDH
jgi:hypothetical protein